MADEQTTAEAGSTEQTTGAKGTASAEAETVTLTRAELDAQIRAEADRRALQAAETARKKAAEKAASEKAQAEKKALEERGEYEKLRELQTAEVERLRQELVMSRVNAALSAAALAGDAPIRDVADLRLLGPDDITACAAADGSIDAAKVTAAIDALRASKPYLFAAKDAQPTPSKGAPSTGSGAPQAPIELTPHDYERIRAARLQAAKSLQAPSADQWASAAFQATLSKTKP
jgi:hypothetical protein